MVEIRVTYTSEEEKDKIINTIKCTHKIVSVSRRYRNFKNKNTVEYRVYVKVEINKNK